MAYEYKLLRTAQADYEEIVSYLITIADGFSTAQNFVDEFDKQIRLVCENPDIHAISRMPELATLGYRPMLVNNYVALYFFREDIVFIAHIFHQLQDYGRYVV
ncbi:MAG: type II toxin-antitoxin system RelE/ParE family toxin [Raoultibacter sp.]|jgi:plasmid stabilization system protein ParE